MPITPRKVTPFGPGTTPPSNGAGPTGSTPGQTPAQPPRTTGQTPGQAPTARTGGGGTAAPMGIPVQPGNWDITHPATPPNYGGAPGGSPSSFYPGAGAMPTPYAGPFQGPANVGGGKGPSGGGLPVGGMPTGPSAPYDNPQGPANVGSGKGQGGGFNPTGAQQGPMARLGGGMQGGAQMPGGMQGPANVGGGKGPQGGGITRDPNAGVITEYAPGYNANGPIPGYGQGNNGPDLAKALSGVLSNPQTSTGDAYLNQPQSGVWKGPTPGPQGGYQSGPYQAPANVGGGKGPPQQNYQRQGGGYLQEGGPAKAKQPYVVGEAGPEVFVPDEDGQVLSHDTFDWKKDRPAISPGLQKKLSRPHHHAITASDVTGGFHTQDEYRQQLNKYFGPPENEKISPDFSSNDQYPSGNQANPYEGINPDTNKPYTFKESMNRLFKYGLGSQGSQ